MGNTTLHPYMVRSESTLDKTRSTQEVPLLTSMDGEPITMGRELYGEDGVRYTITGLGAEHVWGRAGGSKTDKRLRPEWLTVAEPDSWERLQEDMAATGNCGRAMASGLPNAHVDGMSYCTGMTCDECYEAVAAAFVRRAKALGGVEG